MEGLRLLSTSPPAQTLLFLAYQQSSRELEKAIHDGGHPALRPKYGAVFAQLDRKGVRSSDLARRAGMTKAGMGQLIDQLERLGYVERREDPADGRAKLVLPTDAALDVLRIVANFNRSWERRHRNLLGDKAFASLLSSLQTMVLSDKDD